MRTPLSWVLAFSTLVLASLAFADSTPIAHTAVSSYSAKELAQGYSDQSVIAKPKDGVSATALAVHEAQNGMAVRRKLKRLGDLRVLDVPSGKDLSLLMSQMRSSGLYEYVEPNYIKKAHAVPNDPRFTEQWSLRNTGQNGGKSGADIGAVTAWDTRSSAPNIIVAVLDSGIRATHEDLVANLWTNPAEVAGNGVDDDNDGFIDDVHGINTLAKSGTADTGNIDDVEGHGTEVASVIAAAGNNSKGISGVAWQTKLMILKFADADGFGDLGREVTCIDYAIAHGASVINISYGSSQYSQAEYDAIKRARNAGIIVVSSAGNDGSSNDLFTSYPANYLLENVVSVANTDRNDSLAASSNYGGFVDLGAPGTEILVCTDTSDTSYDTVNGTSFSSPLVAGSLALLKAQYPADTYRGLINRLLRSVDPLASLSGKVVTGGRLNLAKALTSSTNRPFNDDFANRPTITGDSAIVRATSTLATAEAGEPTHAAAGGASLWWTWTATRTGSVSIDTAGSSFDTTVAVYTGTAINALTPVASNDDAPGTTTSRLTFSATQGTVYQIAVDGKNGATGLVCLTLGLAPSNDAFSAALSISGVSLSTSGNNTLASRESGEPTLTVDQEGLVGAGKTVWYRWTAPRTSYFAVTTHTDSFIPIVGVFTGLGVSSLTAADQGEFSASFRAIAGTTYYIAVDSANSSSGSFSMNLLEAYYGVYFGVPITPSIAIGSDDSFAAMDSQAFLLYFKPPETEWYDSKLSGTMDVSSPVIGPDGTIYAGTTTTLYAISNSDTITWSRTFSGGVPSSPAIAADGAIYAHSADGYLGAYFRDGTQKWRTAVPGISYASPSIGSDGTIYIGSDDHNMYAISPTDGSIKWKYDSGGEIYSSAAIGSDGSIYFGNQNGVFTALNSSGAKIWSYKAANSISSSPAIAPDGTLYFGCYDGKLYALTSAGTLKWTYATGDEIRGSSPAIASDGTVYIGSYDQSLYAITSTGTLRQTYPTAGIVRTSPVISDGYLIFGSSDGYFYNIPISATAASSPWPMYRQNAARTGRAIPNTAQVIKTQPSSKVVTTGGSTTLAVNAEGKDTLTFQWYFNGAPIAGATSSVYTITNASAANAGNYTVVITNGLGSVTSSTATVSVATASDLGHISNLSARAVAGTGSQTLIVGLIVGGGNGGTKPLLMRGIGPTLASFSVPGYLADPYLKLFDNNGTQLSANDDWANDATLQSVMSQANAFPFTTSKDSALATSLPAGGYTIHVTASPNSTNTTGVAMAEFYDTEQVYTAASSRLTNISARAQVGTGGDVLIVGFIITGSTPCKVLIRGIGPTLAQYGVSGVLADPKLSLIPLGAATPLQENDNWATSTNNTVSELQSAMASVHAFTLDTSSKDAVIVATLQPGAYTATVSGVNSTTGVALAEVYELP